MKIPKRILFFCVVVLCFTNTQCDDDDNNFNPIATNCDFLVTIDGSLYNNISSDNFTFVNVVLLEDNCLSMEISASGCDGNSWEYALVDSGAVAESSPEQRFLKLQLVNNESCLAVFTRTVTFDISSLQIEGSNEISLNIEGYEGGLAYSY